jgi:hypothetical protein
VGDLPYVVVYPLTKKRSWYALPHEERARIMGAHFAVGHNYPDIRIHTGYSFGIDDQEFVVAFEVPDVRRFLALVADLRETESSAYTERETPIFVGAAMPLGRALDAIDGAAVREAVSCPRRSSCARCDASASSARRSGTCGRRVAASPSIARCARRTASSRSRVSPSSARA